MSLGAFLSKVAPTVMIKNYLHYLNQNLGLSEILISPGSEALEAETVQSPPAEDLDFREGWAFESTFSWDHGTYDAFFIRVISVEKSLEADPEALELFEKLRAALGFEGSTAPWIEVPLGDWLPAIQTLKAKCRRFLVMCEEQLQSGGLEGVGAEGVLWMIPDPQVLVEKTELKRPTWELLKEWKSRP